MMIVCSDIYTYDASIWARSEGLFGFDRNGGDVTPNDDFGLPAHPRAAA